MSEGKTGPEEWWVLFNFQHSMILQNLKAWCEEDSSLVFLEPFALACIALLSENHSILQLVEKQDYLIMTFWLCSQKSRQETRPMRCRLKLLPEMWPNQPHPLDHLNSQHPQTVIFLWCAIRPNTHTLGSISWLPKPKSLNPTGLFFYNTLVSNISYI